MKVWQLDHLFGGRNEREPSVETCGVFATPEAALRRVRAEWAEAPEWKFNGDAAALWVVPFKESRDADKPCEGEWWTLSAWEVVE